ncbi:hypothetical protein RS022_04300 [Candidatus Phytoplasma rubi]|uniref:Uncharacterized protein n=1 Tax=Candidatus Phytoplasma rubi TaxID=399025 RepID=A0ABY7BRP9_9MOLU|nr:hypothetical protein RS022_04300 [Candidatus Phytoplasma rubi]
MIFLKIFLIIYLFCFHCYLFRFFLEGEKDNQENNNETRC